MRSDASGGAVPGFASAASTAPRGGAGVPAPPPNDSASAIAAQAASALAKRLTALRVEEVQLGRVDRDRDLLGQAELDVRRELRDQVGPRGDDALLAGRLLAHVLVLALADREGVDPEVDDRLAAERLHQLDARRDRRQLGV